MFSPAPETYVFHCATTGDTGLTNMKYETLCGEEPMALRTSLRYWDLLYPPKEFWAMKDEHIVLQERPTWKIIPCQDCLEHPDLPLGMLRDTV